ncbi:MAG: flagellar assembly protein A [Pseudomonadota bacterium]
MSDQAPAAVSGAPSSHEEGAAPARAPNPRLRGLLQRADGWYAEPGAGAQLRAAIEHVFASGAYFVGLDYAAFLYALYGVGPAPVPAAVTAAVPAPIPAREGGAAPLRFASAVASFDPRRRALYKAVKIERDAAEYYFESVFLDGERPDPGQAGTPRRPAQLDFDEFVADLWLKGIRFGIDTAAVRGALASGKVERLVVARSLPPLPGRDAMIVEVSPDMHRNDAPRLMANGRFDLNSFSNRFPQIKKNERLLRKMPCAPGKPGVDLAGTILPPAAPADLDLAALAGPGTALEQQREGEFLISAQEGFLSVDGRSRRISIGAKIVSRDGVSSRTTGNLMLTGAYEEFGEVQERRIVEGGDITIHGDVFGSIVSRGGDIVLSSNLVGGSAHNADGNIRVGGVASGAVLQSKLGEVNVARAENCVISGSKVVIGQAFNCEILGDEVVVRAAQGCAIAGRRIAIEQAGPRKQSEMIVLPLVPDLTVFDGRLADLEEKAALCAAQGRSRQHAIDALTSQAEVRTYLMLAAQVRKHEVQLTAEQVPQYQKMALAVAPALKEIGRLAAEIKAGEVERARWLQAMAEVAEQRRAACGQLHCRVRSFVGESVARTLLFDPDAGPVYDKPAKEIRAGLRGAASGVDAIFSGGSGSLIWSFQQDDQA